MTFLFLFFFLFLQLKCSPLRTRSNILSFSSLFFQARLVPFCSILSLVFFPRSHSLVSFSHPFAPDDTVTLVSHSPRTSDKFELMLAVRTLSWKTQVSPYTINGNGLFIFLPSSLSHPFLLFWYVAFPFPLFLLLFLLLACNLVNDDTIQLE